MLPGEDRAWKPKQSEPSLWIQWSGSNVCVDFYCSCGAMPHIDAKFRDYLRCIECNAFYYVNPHVEIIPLNERESIAASKLAYVEAADNGDG